jgi:hypothetical protein
MSISQGTRSHHNIFISPVELIASAVSYNYGLDFIQPTAEQTIN